MNRTKRTAMVLVSVVVLVVATAFASSSPVVDIGDGQVDAIGATTTVNITLNEAPEGLSGYNLTISLSNPNVAEIVDVNFPDWATLNDNSSLPADSVWMKCVDLNDKVGIGAANINLGTLTIRGDSPGTTDIIATVTKMDDDCGYPINPSTTPGHFEVGGITYFDTGEGTYPSIMGTHKGTITPNQDIVVQRMYTYPCAGTGGHSEYVKIWNSTWNVTANWTGYGGDWHNISFNTSFTLKANESYNYTIKTGSYPQIHHTDKLEAASGAGEITCEEFVDANGEVYKDWIPAIRLE